jgi:release factor glutamine methyltransferase
MVTVLESINLSTEYLKNKGIESPRVNAEQLLASILNCKRLNLYLNFDRPLSEEELQNYRSYLKRRSMREPLQYIIGKVEFYGLEFIVNPSVLIPRQETEILVETIITLYNKNTHPVKILDIGTGSGNIAVSISKNLPNSSVTAIDISEDALNIANENALLNSVSERTQFFKVDFIKDSFDLNDFDVVVSNPPYIPLDEFDTLQPELKEHEPKVALTDYNSGLSFYEIITERSNALLKKEGRLFFEVGKGQYSKVHNLMSSNNLQNITIIKDYANIERVIFGEKI